MRAADVLGFVVAALLGHRARSVLLLIAMAVGVASVLVLTALGEGARRFVVGEFAGLGTNLVIVLPGRSETSGGPPPLLGETPRDLTLDDALALERAQAVRRVAPVTVGQAPISFRQREREATVIGTTAAFQEVRALRLAAGRFLPVGDPRRARAVCVIGGKLRRELFGAEPAIGRWLRIGDRRFRVAGVLGSSGRSIGLDLDDMIVVPVAAAQAIFDTPALFRILVQASTEGAVPAARDAVRKIIRARHDGEDDVTVISQDAVIATFDRILGVLTVAVGAIAAVSLVVAGILVMNVMLVAVAQRTAEVGLLKALGATAGTISTLFLAEAALVSLAGASAGLVAGYALVTVAGAAFPIIDFIPPPWAAGAATLVAGGTGIAFGVLPARRAAGLDPVSALSRR